MSTKRIPYIDLIKVIAIFMVITLHNGTWYTDFITTGSLQNVIQYCARLFCEGVPVFMLINGFLMFDKKFDAKKHARRTLNVVLILIIWSIILDVSLTLIRNEPLSVLGILTSVLETNISNTHTGILWFLQKLVVVYIVFPVLKYLYDTQPKLFNYLLLVLIISTYSINLISLIAGIFENSILNSVYFFFNQYSLPFATNIYVIYFMLGGYIYKNADVMSKKKYFVLGIACVFIACAIGIFASFYKGTTYSNSFNYSQIFLMFTVIGMFFVCSRIPLNNSFVNKILASIGDNTMGIYLLHIIIISLIYKYNILPTDSLVSRLIMAFAVLLISWCIAVLIRKIPKISFIIKL